MTTFYATCDAESVRPYMPAVPIMVTATSFWRIGQRRRHASGIPTPRLPDHVPEVAADCGGWVAAIRHGGTYPFSFDDYLDWLHTIPRLTWAALPDLPVERELAADRASIRARQELTLAWARELWGESTEHYQQHRVPWAWVATIQGRTVDEYVWMANELAELLVDQDSEYAYQASPNFDAIDIFGEDTDELAEFDAYTRHGAEHVRIGIGSLCRRSRTSEIVAIVRAIADVLPDDRFHLWGVKLDALPALREAGLLDRVASFDSAAWNGRFGSDLEAAKTSGLTQREHTWQIAFPRYRAKIEAALGAPRPTGHQRVLL